MERAIDPRLLQLALGNQDVLPTPSELSEMLVQAEMSILLGQLSVDDRLLATAWYLHGIASSRYALQRYGIDRQRSAFQVSAHIFDLLIRSGEISELEKIKLGFGCQIAYLRSRLDPNAIAIYQREFKGVQSRDAQFFEDCAKLSLTCAIALLGFDLNVVYSISKTAYRQINLFTQDLFSIAPNNLISDNISNQSFEEIYNTPFGTAAAVIESCRDIATYLVYGRREKLETARSRLRRMVENNSLQDDHLSKWVAAHILNLGQDLENSSVWTQLPPDIPSQIRKAFVMGNPKILTLWPPQLDIFQTFNPFDATAKRIFLSTPTSGGKTLIAQLMVVAHVATNRNSVCFIAPTRALCHEIKQSLEERLRFIDTEIISGITESESLNPSASIGQDEPHVEVMTPERLSFLIRTDIQELLNRFGLFIFDEVHLVGDKGRGWTLEEDLTYLHYITSNSHHRITLISAVIGNRNHFVSWMADTSQPIYVHSDWRGPRRLHAIWTDEVDWNSGHRGSIKSKKFTHRMYYPQYGELHIYSPHLSEVKKLRTTERIGELVFKYENDTDREKDTGLSTAFYIKVVPIILQLASIGSVLVIESTKPNAIRMAQQIADQRAEIDTSKVQDLLDLVDIRLTSEHPLRYLLGKGVAYHHGSLPAEIRTSIEDYISQGLIEVVVATTTMTEGINLPVKSVVIASQGTYTPEGYEEYITGSKLINAIGRAGRATRETEGIVVLAWNGKLTSNVYQRLSPTEVDLNVTSNLATQAALEELAAFELHQLSYQDIALEIASGHIADFLKFVWFIIASFEKTGVQTTISDIDNVLKRSLAWQQLSRPNQTRWINFAELVLNNYGTKNPSSRKKWASAGTSVLSASKLEAIAYGLAEELKGTEIPDNIPQLLSLIFSSGRLEQLLHLTEVKQQRYYATRAASRSKPLAIDVRQVLDEWLSGADLISIANNHFSEVTEIGYRFEQLGDFIYYYFEVTLPWLVGIVVSWTNALLEEQLTQIKLPTNLPAFIRWGVMSSVALELLTLGIRSRLLAQRIASEWDQQADIGDIRSWIRSLSLEDWRLKFDATASDLRNLLNFARKSKGGVAANLIMNEKASIPTKSRVTELAPSIAVIRKIDESPFSFIGIWVNEEIVGTVHSGDQSDITDILNLGLDLAITFSANNNEGQLTLELLDPDYQQTLS